MAQLHCYVPDDIAAQFQKKSEQAHLSVSKYLAKLVKQEVGEQWPEGYAVIFDQWQGAPLQRAPQGEFEDRLGLD